MEASVCPKYPHLICTGLRSSTPLKTPQKLDKGFRVEPLRDKQPLLRSACTLRY